MVEITSTEITPPTDDSREFRPMRGISNRHLQTMLPRLIRRKVKFDADWQRLELPDGDFIQQPDAERGRFPAARFGFGADVLPLQDSR